MLDLGVILQLRALYNLVETLRMLSCNLQTRGISYSGATNMINEAIDLITAEYMTGEQAKFAQYLYRSKKGCLLEWPTLEEFGLFPPSGLWLHRRGSMGWSGLE